MQFQAPVAAVGNPVLFLRRAGYGTHRGKLGESSYVRRLDAGDFPRLHLYVEVVGEKTNFNVHLDQRAPLYAGVTAHGGEYDGVVVESEVARLKKLLKI